MDQGREQRIKAAKLLFDQADTDGDGQLSFDEYFAYAKILLPGTEPIKPEIIKRLFESQDTDGDGVLTFEEICNAFFPEQK